MSADPERVQFLIRQAATFAREAGPVHRAIDAEVLKAIGLADDPVLARRIRHGNRMNLEQWLTQTILEPDRIPLYEPTPEILRAIRENARTGWGEVALEAFRAGAAFAWSEWMTIVFGLTDDSEEIRAVLEFSHRSMTSFVADAATAIRAENTRGLAETAEGSSSERRRLVQRVLSGDPVDPMLDGRRLGYRFDRTHQAIILWSVAPNIEPAQLDLVVDELGRSNPEAAILAIIEDRHRRWIWMTQPISTDRAAAICPEDCRMVLGEPRRGLDGFRRTHEDAKIAQRMLAGAAASRRVTRYADVRMIAMLSADDEKSQSFVTEVLGSFRFAPENLQETLRVHLHEGENASRTAQLLSIHRNTVIRHLAVAEDQLPRKLSEARIEIAAALEMLLWLPDAAKNDKR
ncbi:helix-turn-helix domain-containing protein [Notoacmeibacter ruber]|uniref:PucR family transcriptional regulator n=1 Tax=Notoacmeibacter ruber TaxID=2670375 RepID=A0A3L7J7V7_9HYPH|nr:helix-turn-helix domain-containing protein [Notoacmeibacter ruber]RLQ86828.1 hypothetical protein D8780_00015 [Notoacmeibacter ruber]